MCAFLYKGSQELTSNRTDMSVANTFITNLESGCSYTSVTEDCKYLTQQQLNVDSCTAFCHKRFCSTIASMGHGGQKSSTV